VTAEILYCPACPATFVLTSWDVAWFSEVCPKCNTPGRPASELPQPAEQSSFYDLWDKRRQSPEFHAAPRPPGRPGARLDGLCRTVEGATPGTRNATLYWAACRLGEMVASGEVKSPNVAWRALVHAAAKTGLSADEIALTVRSAMQTTGVAS
jgi:hypothetical protein